MTHDQLKNRHREVRDTYPPNLNLRIHRALSWWQRASLADDDDGRYIFLWIAFNAAYATQMDDLERPSESVAFQGFLEKLCSLDLEKRITRWAVATHRCYWVSCSTACIRCVTN